MYMYIELHFLVFRHVHAECDDAIDNLMLERVRNEEQVDYMCSVCRNRDPEVSQQVLVGGNWSFVFTTCMWHVSVSFFISIYSWTQCFLLSISLPTRNPVMTCMCSTSKASLLTFNMHVVKILIIILYQII